MKQGPGASQGQATKISAETMEKMSEKVGQKGAYVSQKSRGCCFACVL